MDSQKATPIRKPVRGLLVSIEFQINGQTIERIIPCKKCSEMCIDWQLFDSKCLPCAFPKNENPYKNMQGQ